MNLVKPDKAIQIPEGMDKANEFTQFCIWSAQPSSIRQPDSQQELAKQLNTDVATLSIWKRHPEFASNRRALLHEWLGDDLPEIMNVVKKNALRGNLGHIQTLLKWLGELADTPVDVQVNNFVVVRGE